MTSLAIKYEDARRVFTILGISVLGIIVASMYVRGVDKIEVAAVALFIPVLVAFVWRGVVAGFLAACAGIGIYVAMRYPGIEQVGLQPFVGLIASRAIALVGFGVVGGWALGQLRGAIAKLERHDEVDDVTELRNARFLLHALELESARAHRYGTTFAVLAVEIRTTAFTGMEADARMATIREIGHLLGRLVRTVDRVVHGYDPVFHRFAMVLPETDDAGARVLASRVTDAVTEVLPVYDEGEFRVRLASVPENIGPLQDIIRDFAAIDALEHPPVRSGEVAA